MEGSLARALYTFQSDNPDELSVPEGSIIKITQYINKHWLEASYQGKTGLFPVTYAERLKNEPQVQKDSPFMPSHYERLQKNLLSSWQPGESWELSRIDNSLAQHSHSSDASFVETAFAFSGRNDSELTFPSGALIEVIKDVDEDWMEGSFNGRTGLFPKSYLKTSERPCARAVYPFVGESAGELTFREGDCIFLCRRLNSQWMEGEIDGTVGLFPSSFVAIEVDLPSEQNSFANGDFSFVDSPPKSQNSSVAPKVKWKRGMKGKALFHFTALYSGDLELNAGDVVTVLEVDDDNWIEGQLASGMRGSCPAAYLEPVFDISQQFERTSSTQRPALDGIFSGIFDDPGYINISQMRSSAQRPSDFVDSYSVKDDTYKSLLDSSFTQDPTAAVIELPSQDIAATQRTTPGTKPLLMPKPGPAAKKQSPSYSVRYLGGEAQSVPKSSHATVSTSISVQSQPGGSAYSSNTLVSVQSETPSKRFQQPQYFQDSTGTWRGKRAGIHGRVTDEDKNKLKRNLIDDDDLLTGNFTSLPTPLVPLPQARVDDRNSESSASEDSPITPRRPAPPPPKRDNSSKNHYVRSQTLPGTRSKGLVQGDFSREVSASKAKDHQQLDGRDVKQNGQPHSPHPVDSKRDSSLSFRGSPKMKRAGDHDGPKSKPLSGPRSVHWKDKDSLDAVDKVRLHSQ